MPRMDVEPLRALADEAPGRVRFVPRFIDDAEIPAIFRRADLVVLPYRDVEQSGVLYTGLAFGKPMVLSAVGGFAEVGGEEGAARLVPPEDAEALAAALEELLADEAARAELAAAARRRRRRAATPGTRSPSQTLALYRELLESRPMIAARSPLLALRRPDRLHARRLPAGAWLLVAAGRRPTHASRRSRRRAAERLADRRRLRRGGGDRGQGRQRARARLPARAARADRRLRRLDRPHRRARARRPAPTWCSTCPAAARSRPRTPPPSAPRGRSLAFSDANCLWAPDALRRWSRRSPTPRSATSAARCASPTPDGGNEEGAYWRYEMAVRELESALAGVTAGNGGDLRGAPRRLHRRCRPPAATTSPSRSRSPSAGCARSTRPARWPRRGWSRRWRASSPASGG